ncbi:MAG: hypothetical protein RR620_04025 [Clostridium sp.]
MRHFKLEKSVKKIDKDIEALKVAAKYLSNVDEINEVKDSLNKKRQELADELYREDPQSYDECRGNALDMLNIELGQEEQKELLEKIKEVFGRQSPNPSKQSIGLNAWLRELDIECEWIENQGKDWAILVLKALGTHKKYK